MSLFSHRTAPRMFKYHVTRATQSTSAQHETHRTKTIRPGIIMLPGRD